MVRYLDKMLLEMKKKRTDYKTAFGKNYEVLNYGGFQLESFDFHSSKHSNVALGSLTGFSGFLKMHIVQN